MKLHHFLGQRGSSLIQVIAAAGIASVVALGVAQMMSDQNKEVKALGEKILTKELELQLKNLFANNDFCNCAFHNPDGTPRRFDMSGAPLRIVDDFLNIDNGYSTIAPPCTVSGGNFIPAVGAGVPGSSMTVGAIGLGPLSLVTPGVYKADLNIAFANSVRSMKPIKTNIQFSINMTGGTGPAARPFVNCGATVPPPTGLGMGQTWQDVTASRAMNTDYVNATALPIMVSVSFATGTDAYLTVGGEPIGNSMGNFAGVDYGVAMAIVPPGATYRFIVVGGSGGIRLPSSRYGWRELR